MVNPYITNVIEFEQTLWVLAYDRNYSVVATVPEVLKPAVIFAFRVLSVPIFFTFASHVVVSMVAGN